MYVLLPLGQNILKGLRFEVVEKNKILYILEVLELIHESRMFLIGLQINRS